MATSLKEYYQLQQFFPNALSLFINPFFFIRKNLVKSIRPMAGELSGKLLDFGCGSKPYESLFNSVDEYIGVDMVNEGHDHQNEDVDVFYDGHILPFEDETFDSVLTSEVLEHVPDIPYSLMEIKRVLKKKGKVLITVPFVWPEHELPYDFRRCTSNGMEHLLVQNGFKPITVVKSGTMFEVIIQLWMMYLHDTFYVKNKFVNIGINIFLLAPFCLFGNILAYILPKKRSLYFNTCILAEKN